MTRRFGLQAAALLSLAGLMASTVASAAEPSIIGRWEIIEAEPAPWSPPELRQELVAEGKGLMHLVVTFAPNAVTSKFKLLNCKRRVAYEAIDLQVDALFQGNLPEPNPAAVAARMGFPRGDIPSVDVQCINAKFTFHFRDADTALINLNRVVYTFKRR